MLKKFYNTVFWKQAFDSFFEKLDSSRHFRSSDRRFDEKRLYWREFGSRQGLSPQMAAYKAMIDCAIIVHRERGNKEWRERFLSSAILGLSMFVPEEVDEMGARDRNSIIPKEIHEHFKRYNDSSYFKERMLSIKK